MGALIAHGAGSTTTDETSPTLRTIHRRSPTVTFVGRPGHGRAAGRSCSPTSCRNSGSDCGWASLPAGYAGAHGRASVDAHGATRLRPQAPFPRDRAVHHRCDDTRRTRAGRHGQSRHPPCATDACRGAPSAHRSVGRAGRDPVRRGDTRRADQSGGSARHAVHLQHHRACRCSSAAVCALPTKTPSVTCTRGTSSATSWAFGTTSCRSTAPTPRRCSSASSVATTREATPE